MSISSDMTHINYKNLKERMSETNKGFWKVQSIHKLNTKLKMRYNPKDYIILKAIKKPSQKIPSFISFIHEEQPPKKQKKLEKQKNHSCGRLTTNNIFITNNIKKTISKEKIEKTKNLFNKMFGKFIYEPYLYNEFQFFSLQKEKRLLPRRFKDVVKDCIALREYRNYISSLQKMKDAKNMTENDVHNLHTNDKESMTVICKKNLNDEIMDKIFREYKNDDSILNDSKNNYLKNNKNMKHKKNSLINIRRRINKNIMIKSETQKNQKRLSLPNINIKKLLKMK